MDINSADKVLTLLVHLGYLAYNENEGTVRIPNEEIREEFLSTVEDSKWGNISGIFKQWNEILDATLKMDGERVAEILNQCHDENISIIQYNNENSLSCVVILAYALAKRYYIIHREFAAGKGFADFVFLPRKGIDKPAIIMELKWGHSKEEAVRQIKEKNYIQKVKEHTENILLAGINYNKKDKKHECLIVRENES